MSVGPSVPAVGRTLLLAYPLWVNFDETGTACHSLPPGEGEHTHEVPLVPHPGRPGGVGAQTPEPMDFRRILRGPLMWLVLLLVAAAVWLTLSGNGGFQQIDTSAAMNLI